MCLHILKITQSSTFEGLNVPAGQIGTLKQSG